jgi:hypothetical protein
MSVDGFVKPASGAGSRKQQIVLNGFYVISKNPRKSQMGFQVKLLNCIDFRSFNLYTGGMSVW